MNRSAALCCFSSLRQLQIRHARALVAGRHPWRQPVSCNILARYADLGSLADARKVFDEIPDPDLVSVTALMSAHLNAGEPQEALSLFSKHAAAAGGGARLDGFAAVGALTASGRAGNACFGKAMHGLVLRCCLAGETAVGNALIDMYGRCGDIAGAKAVFDGMAHRNAVSWTSMLNVYMKCAGLGPATAFFEDVPEKNAFTWTLMITGHVEVGQPVEALELFWRMMSDGFAPTAVTLTGVLSACSDIGALLLGRALHSYASKANFVSDRTVSNALVDMYAKSGDADTAIAIFAGIRSKDAFTWNTIISGLTAQGDGRRAVSLFDEMLSAGRAPDAVTMVSVLSACSHAGMVREGRDWFDKMKSVYGVEPGIEHYGCMVDLFGRAGLLKEAEAFIRGMPIEPDMVIYRSFLSACLIHGDDRLAEAAWREASEREPRNGAAHALMWNVYAGAGRWGDALEARRQMQSGRMAKRPGASWIEVDGGVHEFFVEDKVHGLRREVYGALLSVMKQLEVDGDGADADDDDDLFAVEF